MTRSTGDENDETSEVGETGAMWDTGLKCTG